MAQGARPIRGIGRESAAGSRHAPFPLDLRLLLAPSTTGATEESRARGRCRPLARPSTGTDYSLHFTALAVLVHAPPAVSLRSIEVGLVSVTVNGASPGTAGRLAS